MGVSLNGGTQQPWVFLLKMIILGCFEGTAIYGNVHITFSKRSRYFHHPKKVHGLNHPKGCLFLWFKFPVFIFAIREGHLFLKGPDFFCKEVVPKKVKIPFSYLNQPH